MKANIRITAALLFAVFSSSCLLAQSSGALVDSAWQAWNRNDEKLTERCFVLAQKADAKNPRSYLGLYYLYSMQQNYEAATKQLLHALPLCDNPDPYVYAAWQIILYRSQNLSNRKEIIELFKRLAGEPRTHSTLRAMADAALGDYYESLGDLAASKKYYDAQNAVDQWTLCGPFENISAAGYEKVFPPEEQYDQKGVYEGKNGTPASWFTAAAVRRDRWVDLTHYFADQFSMFYANCFVYLPAGQIADVRIGTSGSLKAYINDNCVLQNDEEYNNDLDTYIARTGLQQGWNRILLKVGFSEIPRCNFMVRITDTLGRPIQGLRVSSDDHQYVRHPNVSPVQQGLFAEQYFNNQLQLHPDRPEYSLLLADCYMHNDKATDAELLLRRVSKVLPGCGLIMLHQIEAYARGHKSDEITKTYEKLLALDPKIPDVLSYRFSRAMQNEDYDEAEKTLGDLEAVMPNSELLFNQKIELYSKKQQIQKLMDVASAAYARYPDAWNFARLSAYMTLQRTRENDSAIAVIEKFVKRVYSKEALKELAQFYLQASKKGKWEDTYRKLLILEPSDANYRFEMASVFFDMRAFAKAGQSIKEALALCPSSSPLWTKLAEIQFAQDHKQEADSAGRHALQCDPGNFHARDLMRECENKESIYKLFDQADIKSLIKSAPDASKYPNDPAVILLDDTKRVLYNQGATENEREVLIKVFNNRGIDMLKEYAVDYHGGIEELIVEKAVVIKKNGSEIKADVDDGHAVFKSLEPDDFIYLKWKARQTRINLLTTMFSDNIALNGFLPVKLSRYALLVTPPVVFSHKTYNMSDNPEVRKTDEGDLYLWQTNDEPAIQSEPEMPPLSQCGKILMISTIPSWQSVVDWYYDLARTRTKSTFEIKEQVADLFSAKTQWTTDEKIKKIFEFVVSNIRYSSVPFRQSGIIPQKARDVLVNRIGDCKDVATLGIAMLKEVGIPAYHVLTRIRSWGSNPGELPSISFNHCIVGIQTEQGMQYADFTATYHPYGSVPDEDHEAFCLLIKQGENHAFIQDPKQWLPNNVTRIYHAAIQDENTLNVDQVSQYYGGVAARSRMMYIDKGETEQQKELSNFLSEDYSSAQLHSLHFKNLENLDPLFELDYTFTVANYVFEAGPYKAIKMPWSGEFKQTGLVAPEKRKFPLLLWFGTDTIREEASITIPDGLKPIEPNSTVNFSCSAAEYSSSAGFTDHKIVTKRIIVFKKTVVPVEEYPAFRTFMDRLAKEEGKQILMEQK